MAGPSLQPTWRCLRRTFWARSRQDFGKIFNPGTLHKYAYAQSNPVNAADPTGQDIVEFLQILKTEVLPTVVYAARLVCYVQSATVFTLVEVPEHDEGKRHVADVIQIGGVRAGLQTIGTRRFQDVSGLTAVAGNAAGPPQLSQWNPASVVSKDNAEGGPLRTPPPPFAESWATSGRWCARIAIPRCLTSAPGRRPEADSS